MTASTEMQGLKEIMFDRRRQSLGVAPPSLREMRAATDQAFSGLPAVPGITQSEVSASGVAAEWTFLVGRDPIGTLLYLHGGGYRVGSIASHRRLVAGLCVEAGMQALSVDYRLAPEHPFPAALEDGIAAYRWLVAGGGESPERVVIAGDSAGGGLLLSVLVSLRDAGDALPAGGYAISPWTDLDGTGDSLRTRADIDPAIDVGFLMEAVPWYVPDGNTRDPLVSPLYADLTGLPPLLVHVGEAEALYDDSSRLAEKAKISGVEVELKVWPEAFHVHHQLAGVLPEADEAIVHAANWLRGRVA